MTACACGSSNRSKNRNIIPNKTINEYLPRSLDTHFFKDIVMAFGRKYENLGKQAAQSRRAGLLALRSMNGNRGDPHFGGVLLPSVSAKEMRKQDKHPHLKEFEC